MEKTKPRQGGIFKEAMEPSKPKYVPPSTPAQPNASPRSAADARCQIPLAASRKVAAIYCDSKKAAVVGA
jgi:hypothetical protein